MGEVGDGVNNDGHKTIVLTATLSKSEQGGLRHPHRGQRDVKAKQTGNKKGSPPFCRTCLKRKAPGRQGPERRLKEEGTRARPKKEHRQRGQLRNETARDKAGRRRTAGGTLWSTGEAPWRHAPPSHFLAAWFSTACTVLACVRVAQYLPFWMGHGQGGAAIGRHANRWEEAHEEWAKGTRKGKAAGKSQKQ